MVKENNIQFIFIMLLVLLFGCKKDEPFVYVPVDDDPIQIDISTNLARYSPGEQVVFTVDKVPVDIKIRIKHLNEIIHEENLISTTWIWSPPITDFKGYMAELYRTGDNTEEIVGTVAVDVSSNWTKFPRYGFLSKYGYLNESQIEGVIGNLKNYHINALQYYDWHNKHHSPLKMEGASPAASWVDIAGNTVYFETVNNYIQVAKSKNMASMFYNLLYGAWDDFAVDGISTEWMTFNDANHQNINKFYLPEGWESDILITNPGNQHWQNYIFQKTQLVYDFLDFDGWHVDQLGDFGTFYNYDGNRVLMDNEFKGFLNQLKTTFPEKRMVLNAVNQFGQEQILNTAVDFAYTEVWSPHEGFADLADIIRDNYSSSNGELKTVLAAYVNYNLANNPGVFNTPGVLLADAVIFAFGGVHLELGEHMLGKEYFPDDNLLINQDLKTKLLEYYDFLVAYQNLLRDGGVFNNPVVNSGDGKINLNNWPPMASKVSVVGKEWSDKQVIHLLNFTDAINLNWRDTNGEQHVPGLKEQMLIQVQFDKTVTNVWFASPDVKGGSTQSLDFSKNGNVLSFKVPELRYWSMIVIECG
ncbi:MAG: glycoside hydrolase family 66 protein [Bacteroidales bacterium]|nr:glycoside hydrolase family 66 protein [Bacteroidales bacterium]